MQSIDIGTQGNQTQSMVSNFQSVAMLSQWIILLWLWELLIAIS
jgi:hypothetical protein